MVGQRYYKNNCFVSKVMKSLQEKTSGAYIIVYRLLQTAKKL
jgi:hypothetical protein